MKHQHITKLMVLSATAFVVSAVLAAQSQDRFTLKTANGIAFSEFRDYEAWQLVATSQPDDASGCGTSKVGCTKAILGNPAMIRAYRDGIPANGQAFPDGAAVAKIEWLKDHNNAAPYPVTVPGTQTEVSFMVEIRSAFPTLTDGDTPRSSTTRRPPRSSRPSRPRRTAHGLRATGATRLVRRRATSFTPTTSSGDRRWALLAKH